MGFERSRDVISHVTVRKVKVNIFGARYLDDGWRYGVGANRAPIGNDYWELNGHVNDDVA